MAIDKHAGIPWLNLAREVGVYFLKSLLAILLSALLLLLVAIMYISAGLSLAFAWLRDTSYQGANILATRWINIRWYFTKEKTK